MALLDSIMRMAPTQGLQHGLQFAGLLKAIHREAQRLHQLIALLLYIVLEHWTQRRIQREEMLVECQRGNARLQRNQRECFPNERDLLGGHKNLRRTE